MILVGQYDSPFVRRVAISLRVLGFAYQHDTRSVFGDFDSMRTTNPLGRIPSLTLDSGETLIDSVAILDWLDREVGPDRALTPASGAARTRAMQLIALAAGGVEKFGAENYESIIRPAEYRWPDWIARLHTQGLGALAALEHEDWTAKPRLDQVYISTGCLLGYLALTQPNTLRDFPRLSAFWDRCAAMPEFIATSVAGYGVPKG
ncbi:MAG: glutathione S-transferase family protein [Proteobacteria bacterium]|nr:glutathione S-transferase family protein [Pseudomonadota bacterium]